MVFVAICDGEIHIGAKLERTLIDIFGELNVKYEIDIFFSGDELCRKMEAGSYYDLVFLDIGFGRDEISGIEAGRLIRDTYQNDMVSIVYISWEKNYAMQLFDIRPLNFLVKPLKYEKIEQVIRTYLKIAGLWSKEFTFKKKHDTFKVQMKDIIYLESHKSKLILHLADGRAEEFYGALKRIYQEQLKAFDFLLIHASYAVNYDYITSMKYNHLFLIDNPMPFPISHHRRKEVRETYHAIARRRR